MEYRKKVTTKVIEDILSKGVKTMPQNPASVGYTPAQIRAFYYKPEELILELLSNVEDDVFKVLENINDLFVVADDLPTASKDTKGKIYLVPLTDSEEKNKYIEYITVKNGEEYSWEKVGIKELNIIYDNELNEQSENAIKNKVVAQAIASLVTEIGKKISTGTLATINGQSIEEGGNIDLTEYQKKVDNGLLTTDKTIVGAINELNEKVGQGGSNIEVDNELDAESENPVQNKVVTEALGGKVDIIPNDTGITKVYAVSRNGVYLSGMIQDSALIGYIPQFSARKTLVTETATKDLECVNLKQLNTLLEGKLDKITTTSGLNRLYGVSTNGDQREFILASSAGAGSADRIAQYFDIKNTQGDIQPPACLLTRIPQKPYQCANKQFVEDLVASVGGGSKTYIHNIITNIAGTGADGFPISIISKITGISKYETAFTYVQGKGICLGTFNFNDHPEIMEFGVQPEVFTVTSAFLNDITEIVLSPTVKGVRELNSDYTNGTVYLTKIEDVDLTNLENFYDYVSEA